MATNYFASGAYALALCVKKAPLVTTMNDEGDRPLGEGGAGEVSGHFSKTLCKSVARKRFKYPLSFHREYANHALVVSRGTHENSHLIATMTEWFTLDGDFFMYLEPAWCDFHRLTFAMDQNRQFLKIPQFGTATAIEGLMVNLLKALVFLHEDVRILHNDVKPANILYYGGDRVKLADLGICSHSSHGPLRGTTGYTAPEYWEEGFRHDDWNVNYTDAMLGKPDVFGLGQAFQVIVDGDKSAHTLPENVRKAVKDEQEAAKAEVLVMTRKHCVRVLYDTMKSYYKNVYKAVAPDGYNVNALSQPSRLVITEMCTLYQMNRPTAKECLEHLSNFRTMFASDRVNTNRAIGPQKRTAEEPIINVLVEHNKRTRTILITPTVVNISDDEHGDTPETVEDPVQLQMDINDLAQLGNAYDSASEFNDSDDDEMAAPRDHEDFRVQATELEDGELEKSEAPVDGPHYSPISEEAESVEQNNARDAPASPDNQQSAYVAPVLLAIPLAAPTHYGDDQAVIGNEMNMSQQNDQDADNDRHDAHISNQGATPDPHAVVLNNGQGLATHIDDIIAEVTQASDQQSVHVGTPSQQGTMLDNNQPVTVQTNSIIVMPAQAEEQHNVQAGTPSQHAIVQDNGQQDVAQANGIIVTPTQAEHQQNAPSQSPTQVQFALGVAVAISVTLTELAAIAVMCVTPHQVEMAVANDATKTNTLMELRMRESLTAPITDLAKLLLYVVHIPGTKHYESRAKVFQLLTGYSVNWWKTHRRLIVSISQDAEAQHRQQQHQQQE